MCDNLRLWEVEVGGSRPYSTLPVHARDQAYNIRLNYLYTAHPIVRANVGSEAVD